MESVDSKVWVMLNFNVVIRFLICLMLLPLGFLCLVAFFLAWPIFSSPCYITKGWNPGQTLASSLAEI